MFLHFYQHAVNFCSLMLFFFLPVAFMLICDLSHKNAWIYHGFTAVICSSVCLRFFQMCSLTCSIFNHCILVTEVIALQHKHSYYHWKLWNTYPTVLQLEGSSSKHAKLHTLAASNTITHCDYSIIGCSCYIHIANYSQHTPPSWCMHCIFQTINYTLQSSNVCLIMQCV